MQTVVLSQLDSLRRELITIAQDGSAAVTYSKVRLQHIRFSISGCWPVTPCTRCDFNGDLLVQEVVREVQAFAEMRDDFTTDSDTESDMTYEFAEDGSVYSNFSPDRCIYTPNRQTSSVTCL